MTGHWCGRAVSRLWRRRMLLSAGCDLYARARRSDSGSQHL